MSPFDEGFFSGGIEELFNQLTGTSRRTSRKNNNSTTLLNTLEKRKETLFIFDLSGKEDIKVEVKDELEEDEYKEKFSTGKKILEIRSKNSETIRFILPKGLKQKNIETKIINGILEVRFKKWKRLN